MSNGHDRVDVLIVGGGIIGLSVALRASSRGMSVALLERDSLGAGSSNVAAGMLAPVTEVEFGGAARGALELGMRSASMWPGFARELERIAGMTVGFRQTGTLLLARDQDEALELERQISLRDSLGLHTQRLLASQARSREPSLAPTVRLALSVPGDHSVDPRLVIDALRRACELEGVILRERTPVQAVEVDRSRERVSGVRLANGELVKARVVVVASGAWSGQLEGLLPSEQVPVRPIKGQILRLRDPAGEGLLNGVVRFQGGYLVPRGDGRYVLGASMEERGFESLPTAGILYELLRDAHELVPGVSELQIEEIGVGLRPGTPDNVPLVGPGAIAGLIWATGHYRNGILLAPLTADLVLEMLTDTHSASPSELALMCAPARFVDERQQNGLEGVLS